MPLHLRDSIQPISDFRKGSAQILKKLREAHQPIILTQRGRSVAVLLDLDTYERLDYENRLRASYRRGVQDIEQGKTVSHSKVMKMLDQRIKQLKTK